MSRPSARETYLLKITCPDVTGIVAAVSGFLATHECFITESHHYGDRETEQFFMRTVFEPPDRGLAPSALRAAFAEVAGSFRMEWTLSDLAISPNVLILVSKFDHCLSDILYRWRTGALKINIPAIVSNHMDLAGIAEQHNIAFFHIPVTPDAKTAAEARLFDVIADAKVDIVVLARYMQVLSPAACERLRGRAINIHHSFLPSFVGAKPYHQAHDRGVKLIGATAHYITAELDAGPIIEQMVERVDHTMSVHDLIATGRDIERLTLARALKAHAEHRVFLNGHRTVVMR